MPYFDGADGRVYYRHWATDAPHAAVVFLHGFGEHTGLYHRLGAALNARGIDLWALDHTGHGLSDGDRGAFGDLDSLGANAWTLVDLARTAIPGVPTVLAGHSLGSAVAALTALDHPGAFVGAVLSGAPLSPVPWLSEAVDAGTDTVDLDPAALSSDPFYLDQLATDPLAFTSADAGAALAAVFPAAWDRLERELSGLALPILAVHGSADVIAPLDGVRAWTGRLPGLQVRVFDGAGHDVLNEVAHIEVAARIADFVLERAGVPV